VVVVVAAAAVIVVIMFYGCKTWPLTVRKEHTLKVLENRALRKIL